MQRHFRYNGTLRAAKDGSRIPTDAVARRRQRMDALRKQAASVSLGAKLAFAVLGILPIHGAFRLLEIRLPRHFGRADARYRVGSSLSSSDMASPSCFWCHFSKIDGDGLVSHSASP